MGNDTASTDTRQSSTKPRQQGEYRRELFKTERLCFGFLCERPNYGVLKSCQGSYFRWLSAGLLTAWRNIPRLFQTKCLRTCFFIPFHTARPFLCQQLTEIKATALEITALQKLITRLGWKVLAWVFCCCMGQGNAGQRQLSHRGAA